MARFSKQEINLQVSLHISTFIRFNLDTKAAE
jgi:hypothetical protein